jgi:3-deoxy-D-manno-octulosonic-acid transferase
METEIWPNLYHECGRREIPLVLVSARISPKSVASYKKFLPLFRETLSHGIVIAAQSQADADRFRQLGAAPERTWVTGNIKFDIQLPPELAEAGEQFRRDNFEGRPVWVAASTHDKEEQQVLHAHDIVQEQFPDALLILIPRHPERFPSVRTMLHKEGRRFISRTDGLPCTSDIDVFFGDTMGEVPLFYAASNVAFVGGTLVEVGGHNLLEPAALGRPVVTGPHLYNTQDIADKFEKLGASITVNNAGQLGSAIADLFADPDTANDIGSRGRDIVQQNRGSLKRLLEMVEPLISKN